MLVIDLLMPPALATGRYDLESPLVIQPGSPSNRPHRTTAVLYVATGEESPIFDRDVFGTLEVTNAGEEVSGRFQFTAYEAVSGPGGGVIAGDRLVDVEGTFEGIPLTVLPWPEGDGWLFLAGRRVARREHGRGRGLAWVPIAGPVRGFPR